MAEGTVRKSTVEFRVIATGTFVVDHVEGESPAEELKRLIDMRGLSWVDLYLHSEEFDWSIEATDRSVQGKQGTDLGADDQGCSSYAYCSEHGTYPCPGHSDQEWFDRTVRDEAPADEDELYRRQADAQDAELREQDRLEREEIGDAMREQWEQR